MKLYLIFIWYGGLGYIVTEPSSSQISKGVASLIFHLRNSFKNDLFVWTLKSRKKVLKRFYLGSLRHFPCSGKLFRHAALRVVDENTWVKLVPKPLWRYQSLYHLKLYLVIRYCLQSIFVLKYELDHPQPDFTVGHTGISLRAWWEHNQHGIKHCTCFSKMGTRTRSWRLLAH